MNTKLNRIIDLNIALQYCSENDGFFTNGERICINQERGNLFQSESPETETAPEFPHDEKLNRRIDFIIEKTKKTGFKPMSMIWNI